ncbi:uncharacterized protein LOC130757733 [Actinidia eriantha]|uniref:uncharacterized protein LOC130757733 n=1 Tax=Actinidia eriantha TaxID=165200 RepID=UPI00258E293C|nr:uncharacterized protein LOC130757733 [Actinidia eriantha]
MVFILACFVELIYFRIFFIMTWLLVVANLECAKDFGFKQGRLGFRMRWEMRDVLVMQLTINSISTASSARATGVSPRKNEDAGNQKDAKPALYTQSNDILEVWKSAINASSQCQSLRLPFELKIDEHIHCAYPELDSDIKTLFVDHQCPQPDCPYRFFLVEVQRMENNLFLNEIKVYMLRKEELRRTW